MAIIDISDIHKVEISDGAGTANTKQLGTAITTSDVALVTQGVIHGVTTGGGGGYVDVKVNPSGALTVDATLSTDSVGLARMGVVDSNNSTTTLLNASATFTGTAVDVSKYPSVIVALKTDQDGSLYIEFSPDGTNWDSSLMFSIAAGVNEVHRISVTRRYFRIRIINTSVTNQTYLRCQALLGSQQALTSALNSTIQNDADSLVTRSVLMGQTDGGQWKYVPVTNEGHLETVLHGPINPFYSLHTESLTSVFQTDAVYNISNGQTLAVTSLSGTVTQNDSLFNVGTGTTIYGYGVLESRKRLRYRAGQGSICRYTAVFSSPVINNYQLAGLGHSEDGLYFGYGNTSNLSDLSFGILYVNRGVREIKTLTVTARATAAGNVTITLNGTAFTVAVTNSTLQQNVWEISQGTYAGWDAYANGATIVFLRKSSGTTAGTQSSSGPAGYAGTFVQTKAGAASTDTFIPQSSWNGDKLDGTGGSGVTLNPQKLNVFQIKLQYLGAGAVTFQIEAASSDTNNPVFVDVHTIKFPNTLTTSSLGNPSLPFTIASYSAGSTTNQVVKCASFAGFIEGDKKLHGNRFSYNGTVTANTTLFNAELTILNPRVYSNRSNQSVINLLSITFAQNHNNVTTVYLIKNGALVGAPSFATYSTNSMSLVDTAATSVTYTDNSQVVWSGQLGATSNLDFAFTDEITLQPGEWVTVAAKSLGGGPVVAITLNTREDQ